MRWKTIFGMADSDDSRQSGRAGRIRTAARRLAILAILVSLAGTPGSLSGQDSLEAARAELERARGVYTRLVTTGGEGDRDQAMADYRAALQRVEELEARPREVERAEPQTRPHEVERAEPEAASPAPPETPPESAAAPSSNPLSQMKIGPAGGHVEAEGLCVRFPAGALEKRELVTVRCLRPVSGMGALYAVDRKGGHGRMASPVTLEFLLPSGTSTAGILAVQEASESEWCTVPHEVDAVSGTLKVQVQHFSSVGWFDSSKSTFVSFLAGGGETPAPVAGDTASLPSLPRPKDFYETSMPAKGTGEINVAITGTPTAPTSDDDLMKRYLQNLETVRSIDELMWLSERKQFFTRLEAVVKSGRRIKTLIVAGHGDRGAAGLQISSQGDLILPDDVDFRALNDFVGQQVRHRQEARSRMCQSAGESAAADREHWKQKAEYFTKELDWAFERLYALESVRGVMADGGLIVFMQCFSSRDAAHLAFSQNLAQALFGENSGTIITSTQETGIYELTNTGRQAWQWLRTGTVGKQGDVYVAGTGVFYGKWETRSVSGDVKPLSQWLRATFEVPGCLEVSEGEPVTIAAPSVEPFRDSDKIHYMWQDEALSAGTEARCQLDTKGRDGQVLTVRAQAGDRRGRLGEDCVFVSVKKEQKPPPGEDWFQRLSRQRFKAITELGLEAQRKLKGQ